MGDVSPGGTSVGEQEQKERTTHFVGGGMVWQVVGNGPTLVLLHGGAGSWTHWMRNIDDLSAHFRLLVPDIPGFGKSDTATPPHDVDAIAAAIIEGINELVGATAQIFLVGFSFGGLIAGLVASKTGGRVQRLVLVSPSGLGLTSSTSLQLRTWRGLANPDERNESHRHNLRVLMLASGTEVGTEMVQIQAQNVERARLDSRLISRRPILRETLERLQIPLGAIWGAEDVLVQTDLQQRIELLRSSDPICPIEVIAKAGHWVAYERPIEFNTALRTILSLKENDRIVSSTLPI